MKWLDRLRQGLRDFCPPDFVIYREGRTYLKRWWLIPRNRRFNIYLHHFVGSDDDRALHDHPWWNVSILLRGRYLEITPDWICLRQAWLPSGFVFRRADQPHRIELYDGPAWTLFITGPHIREWGFHCPQGWRHWRDFLDPNDPGRRGPGCD